MPSRFKVKVVQDGLGFIKRTVSILDSILEDPDVVDGYDLKFVTPIAAGGGYTDFVVMIFERKEDAPSIDPE